MPQGLLGVRLEEHGQGVNDDLQNVFVRVADPRQDEARPEKGGHYWGGKHEKNESIQQQPQQKQQPQQERLPQRGLGDVQPEFSAWGLLPGGELRQRGVPHVRGDAVHGVLYELGAVALEFPHDAFCLRLAGTIVWLMLYVDL